MKYTGNFRQLFTYEGIVFTIIFTLLFSTVHLAAIDFGNLGSIIKNDSPFYILILAAVFVYLKRNSEVVLTGVKSGFYIIWILYILSVFINDVIRGDFSWTSAAVYLLISLIFLYKIPSELIMFVITGGVISSFVLLGGINGSGVSAAAALILISAFILFPKTNQTLLFYLLPAAAVILTIPFSGTALITMFGVFTARFLLNSISSSRLYISPVIVALSAVIIFSLIFIYNNFYKQENLHTVFNTLLETNGVITLILFIMLLVFTAVLSVPFPQAENISLYIIAFAALLIFEPEYFTKMASFTPVIIIILLLSIILSNERKDDYHY